VRTTLLVMLLVLVAVKAVAPAQPRLTSGIELVHLDATVVDATGRMVTGLPADAFEVFEDGRKQDVALFVRDRLPTSILVLVDISCSMAGERYKSAVQAIESLIAALGPEDRWSVVGFNHQMLRIARWSAPTHAPVERLRRLQPGGGTALFFAVGQAVRELESSPTRKRAVIVLTDGSDSMARNTLGPDYPVGLDGRLHRDGQYDDEEDGLTALQKSDALLYALAIDWPPDPTPCGLPAELLGVDVGALTRLASPTGGAALRVQNRDAFNGTARQIVTELGQQYTLGYVPPTPRDGKLHRITVTTRDPEHKVRARTAYLAKR
jgi:Ca-activated chloride channel family protein